MWRRSFGRVLYEGDGGAGGGTGGNTSGGAGGNTGGSSGSDRTFTQAEVNQLMGTTRQEARDRATGELLKELGLENVDALKGLVTQHRERENAGKTEAEKLKADLAERDKVLATLRQQNRDLGLRQALAALTGDHAVADVNLAADALLASGLVEFNDDSSPKDLQGAVQKLVEKYPLLKAAGTTGSNTTGTTNSGGTTNPARQGGNVLTREAIERMSPDEINANWDRVQAVLSSK
jgi:hypothetical protein